MASPLRETFTMTSRRFRLLVVVMTTIALVVILYYGRSSGSRSSKGRRDASRLSNRDPSTLSLSQEAIKKLSQRHVFPIKSRGATIFTDPRGQVVIPPDDIVDLMKFRDLEELYHRYLETIQATCHRLIHIGSLQDGGYDVCDDVSLVPQRPCLVYSFGIRNDFSFDEELSKMYGCEIHSFDPNNGMKDHQHSTNVTFHATGLGKVDGVMNTDWRMRTLDSIKQELGHKKVDMLKIDIEAGEWEALPEILSRGSLQGVRQLIMEFHSWVDLEQWGIDKRSSGDYKHNLKVLKSLYDEGFRIFYFKRFPADCCVFEDEFGIRRTGCHEVSLLRVPQPRN